MKLEKNLDNLKQIAHWFNMLLERTMIYFMMMILCLVMIIVMAMAFLMIKN